MNPQESRSAHLIIPICGIIRLQPIIQSVEPIWTPLKDVRIGRELYHE